MELNTTYEIWIKMPGDVPEVITTTLDKNKADQIAQHYENKYKDYHVGKPEVWVSTQNELDEMADAFGVPSEEFYDESGMFEAKLNQIISNTFKIATPDEIPPHLLDQNNIKKLCFNIIDGLAKRLGINYQPGPQETGFKTFGTENREFSVDYSIKNSGKINFFVQILPEEKEFQITGELFLKVPLDIQHEPADYEDGHLRSPEYAEVFLSDSGSYLTRVNVDLEEGVVTNYEVGFEDLVNQSINLFYEKIKNHIETTSQDILRNIEESQY